MKKFDKFDMNIQNSKKDVEKIGAKVMGVENKKQSSKKAWKKVMAVEKINAHYNYEHTKQQKMRVESLYLERAH